MRLRSVLWSLVAALPLAAPWVRGGGQSSDVVLATTTSTRDAGLLDSILPIFERETGFRVKVVAVGSGQALELGRRGEADLVLSHAPEAERILADRGYFVARRLMMHNEFLIVGPVSDPAGLRQAAGAAAAFRRLAAARAVFVSRGDQSGTHLREKQLWTAAGLAPPTARSWYLEAGQGMAATLQIANERQGYTLTDVATYLTQRGRLDLVPVVQGDPILFNVYHVLTLNPRNGPRVNATGGETLAAFFLAPATQRLIGQFGVARFGRSLFVPDAGKPDRW